MAEKIFLPIAQRDFPNLITIQKDLDRLSIKLYNSLNDFDSNFNCKELVQKNSVANISNLFIERNKIATNHLVVRKNKQMKTFKGIYVFGKQHDGVILPVYFGISQNIARRVRGHLLSNNLSTASWANLMYKHELRNQGLEIKIRPASPKDLRKYQLEIEEYYFAFILEKNDYIMYLLEAFASIKYKSFWNIFNTH